MLSFISRPACCCLLALLLVAGCYAEVPANTAIARASALSHSGKTKQAEALLRSAVASHPDSAELHGALGELLFRQQRYEQAVQELGTAAQGAPDSREYNLLLAEALIGWGHFGVAVDFLNAVRPRFGSDVQYHYDLGLAYYNLNKVSAAQEEVEEALRLRPTLDPAQYVLGSCLMATGDSAGALRQFRKLVQEKPGKGTYWAALAQVLQATGSPSEALGAVQRALMLSPRDAHVQYVAATVFTESGQFARARPLLERLEKLDPGVLSVHVQLARVYSRLGERELARKEAEAANELRARTQPSTPADQAPTTRQER
jgi:predicted Zn-dependent protease